MAMKFYAVMAKCGHVGRHQYYEGTFYEKAFDAKTAAAIVRYRPRVKHDHKDAILRITEISYDEFKVGKAEFDKNPYHKCESKWQQWLVWDEIIPFIRSETSLYYKHRNSEPWADKPQYLKVKVKKPYKRERLSMMREYDYAFVI